MPPARPEFLVYYRDRAPESIDADLALGVYAAVAVLSGAILAAWGPMWLGAHVTGLPWGRAALIRVCGAVIVAAGLCGAGLAAADRHTRRQMLSWFIAGHVVVWLMLVVQIAGPLGDVPLASHASWAMLATILGLLYVRFPSTPRRRAPVSAVDAADAHDASATRAGRHEQHIRDAAAQEERNRLARDLHDAVKQQIFAIQTSAATAETRLDEDAAGARQALAQVRQSAREAMTEMEAMLEQLRVAPLGNTGLVEAIRKQCEALAFRTGAIVDVEIGPLPADDALEPGAHQAIFRIVQEALANIGRHARAHRVRVSLQATSVRLVIGIQDDGRGFDPGSPPGGMGMHNMRTRAREIGGSLELESGDRTGTRVTLSVPFETRDARAYLRRRALGLAVLVGVGALILLRDLIENGPAIGNVSLLVFMLLFVRHLRAWLRLRRRDGGTNGTAPEGES